MHVEAVDLNEVGRDMLPISRTNLDSYNNVVSAGRNYQITSETSRTGKASSFTPGHESTCQAPIMVTTSGYDSKRTRESNTLKVRDALTAPAIYNTGPLYA